MIGQGTRYVKLAESAMTPLLSSDHPACGDEVLMAGICPSFTSCPLSCSAPGPGHGDLRRLSKAPHPSHILKCPRCDSPDTKFCYYNNYSLSQPRHFCKNCKRYWTAGGALRNVPVGGGLRKNKRFKLRLQAEAAEAAASSIAIATDSGAAMDESAQLQHYQNGKPPSSSPARPAPSRAAAGGSSSTTGNSSSSVVSGIPANSIAAAVPPSVHSSQTNNQLMRTSSVSDGSTVVDYAGNDNCSSTVAAAAQLQLMDGSQQSCGNQLQHFFGDLCGHGAAGAVPKLYPSSYSTSSDASNLQQHSITLASSLNDQKPKLYHSYSASSDASNLQQPSITLDSSLNDQKPGSPSYQAMGYAHQLAVQGSCCSMQDVLRGSDEAAGSIRAACANNCRNGAEQAPYQAVNSGNGGGDVSSNDHLQQKEELISINSHFNWQLIPDNLFSGSASEGFLPLPGGSWPDFLQFQDPSAPV